MSRIGLYQHADCGRHDTGWRHPEHQGRLRGVMQALDRALPDLHEHMEPIVAEHADRAILELAHTPEHIRLVETACEEAAASGQILSLDPDTIVSPASWDAAMAAVGCATQAVDAVLAGRHPSAFCPVRPPGHHATPNRGMGFCLFNNVAIAARHALAQDGVDRVLIVDWDVHHGNGTQDIFWEDPDVFFLSMHQSPLYPGTGAASETGAGEGGGTTLNLPMAPGQPPEVYVETFLEGVDRALETFAPDFVLISAGFDAAEEDPLGGFTLRGEDFRALTLGVIERTRATSKGVVSLLEGGYNPEELGRNVVTHLKALIEAAES